MHDDASVVMLAAAAAAAADSGAGFVLISETEILI